MAKQLRSRILLILTFVFGGLTLFGGLLYPPLGSILLGWGSFLAAVALMLGVINLLSIHLRRVGKAPLSQGYSLVLVLSFFFVVGAAIFDATEHWLGYADVNWLQFAFDTFIRPVEAALGSLLLFFLVFATFRLVTRRQSRYSWLFVFSIIFFILLQTPFLQGDAFVGQQYLRLAGDSVVLAGMRGILLGVAIGTIIFALRLLMGDERPYQK